MQTWSGIIQDLESIKASEQPVVDDGDLIGVQVPVKGRYELAWRYLNDEVRRGVIGACSYTGVGEVAYG